MAKAGVRTVRTVLEDQTTVGRRKARKVDVNIKMTGAFIEIHPDGYGECEAADNAGSPVVLEYYEGKLRVLVFADINDPDPTHAIDLEGAREAARKPDKKG